MAASQITLWRLISGTFGVMCLTLMVTLGILLKNTFTKQSIQSTFSPEPIKELQEVPDCCSCQEQWIGYKCNCYFISDEKNTWKESNRFCAFHNSSLLRLQNSNELAFMRSTQQFYWTGLSFTKEHGAWLWEDGSAPSQDLLSLLPTPTPGHCVVFSPRRMADSKLCGTDNRYICKQRLI